MDVDVDGETFRVEIERAHMEEDTGKSTHMGGATGRIHGADYSLVDYNRAGIPLIEIVTKPILGAGERAPEVAKAYVSQLRDLIVALGVSEARMDQGNLRADVNLSLVAEGLGRARHPHGDQERELVPVGRAGGALRDAAARRGALLGHADPAGDPALARGHRRHHQRSREVRRRRLPLLPRARPGARRAVPRVGRRAARHPAGEPDREAGPAPGGVGVQRPRDARHDRRGRAGADRGDGRGRYDAADRPEVVAGRVRTAGQRPGRRDLRARRRPVRGGRRPGARRRRHPQRQARPAGLRRAVRRRGHARGDRGGPRAGDRLRRGRPVDRRRQRDRRQPGRRRQDPGGQGRRGRVPSSVR